MSLSIYATQALLNSLFGKTSAFGALASAPTIYVALSTADPGEDGSGIAEPVGGSYARVQTAAADWTTASGADPSVLTNANPVTFPEATGSWGTITHMAFFDAASAGNFLGATAVGNPQAVVSGNTPNFAAGQISVSMD